MIQIHNNVDDNVLYKFRCYQIEGKPVVQLVGAEIYLNMYMDGYFIETIITIPVRTQNDSGIDIFIKIPKVYEAFDRFSKHNIIAHVKTHYLGLIKTYCSTMIKDINDAYRNYRVDYVEGINAKFTLPPADSITDPNLDNALMSMQVVIDDHVLHLSLKSDNNFVSVSIVSQDDAWYFDKGELYIYYVMNKIAQKFNEAFPNKGYSFFCNTDCRGSQSYEYIIYYSGFCYVSTFDNFYVHVVVPEGDIYCGPNTEICGDDHFRFILSEPNQNMCHEDYLKLKEKYFRIYSKEFEDFYMKYSAE